MLSKEGHLDIGVVAPGLSKPAIALVTLYICVCGLCSLCPGPMAVALCVCLMLAELIAGARFLDTRHPTVPYLIIIWVLTIYTAALVGMRNHHTSYFPYRAALEGRTYTAISPTDKASAHADGGIIEFADGANLMPDQSVGLKIGGRVYCAAPIVGSDTSAKVQFFAIGEGCCAARGSFQCDDVASGAARGGIVMHEPIEGPISHRLFAPDSRRPDYMKAAMASMVLSNQQMAPQPVFLRWVEKPKDLLRQWLTVALLVWICSSIAFSIIVSLLWFVVDFHFHRILCETVTDQLIRAKPVKEGHPKPAGPAGNTSARFSLPWRTAAAPA
jgi:hypothetical protein